MQSPMLRQYEQRSGNGGSNSSKGDPVSSSAPGKRGSDNCSHTCTCAIGFTANGSSRSAAAHYIQTIAATVTRCLAGCYIGVHSSTELHLVEDRQLAVCNVDSSTWTLFWWAACMFCSTWCISLT